MAKEKRDNYVKNKDVTERMTRSCLVALYFKCLNIPYNIYRDIPYAVYIPTFLSHLIYDHITKIVSNTAS